MDRDTRWDRVKLATTRSSTGQVPRLPMAGEAVADSYEHDLTDEFIKPTVIAGYDGAREGDTAIFINFRPDRPGTHFCALAEPDFDEFVRSGGPLLDLTTMTSYREGWPTRSLPEERPKVTMAQVIAGDGGRQPMSRKPRSIPRDLLLQRRPRARMGGEDRAWSNPRDVPTYDFKPEMSANQAADAFVAGGRKTNRASGSSTSPTRTWSDTGVIPAAVRRSRRLTPPRPGGQDRPRLGRGLPDHQPITATPTTCLNPTARRTPLIR